MTFTDKVLGDRKAPIAELFTDAFLLPDPVVLDLKVVILQMKRVNLGALTLLCIQKRSLAVEAEINLQERHERLAEVP